MKKKYLYILGLFLIIGIISILLTHHHKILKDKIITDTYQDNHIIMGISYPKTNTKLDKEISNYITSQIHYFKSNYGDSDYLVDRDELNIDYQYKIYHNRYISLVFTTYINSYKLNQPIYEVQSYFYDAKKDKFLSLTDLLEEQEQISLYQYIKNDLENNYYNYIIVENLDSIISLSNLKSLPFYIDNKNINIYFTPDHLVSDYYDILEIKISREKIPIKKIKLESKSNELEMKEINTASNIIDPSKKVVALTFDDGPSCYTKEIIKILKEYDVNATFFILGNKVETYQEVLLESIQNGNELGNHSYNHKWLSRLSTKNLINQIESTQKITKEKLNYEPEFLRPTYGSVTNRIRNNTNLKIVLWTVDTKDWKIKNVDRIVEKATTNIEDEDIILMHDIFERTSLALKKIIPILKEQGFQFVTLSELEEIKLLRTRIG